MSEPVRVLWTGGWDSTYRILDLTITYGRDVQPFYVIDPQRRSLQAELDAMASIVKEMRLGFPSAGRVLPVDAETRVPDIAPDEGITASAERLQQRGVGSQYDWLARFAAERGLGSLELGIEAEGVRFLGRYVRKLDRPAPDDAYVLVEDITGEPDLHIFKCYRLPLLEMTKKDMEREARSRGFGDLMELTWFCFRPIDGRPCGICNPCRLTRKKGLRRRVPNARYRRVRRRAQRIPNAVYQRTPSPLKRLARKIVGRGRDPRGRTRP